MSEKRAEKSIEDMKQANISNKKVNESDLEEVIEQNKKLEEIKQMEEEKKSKATSRDAP